MFDDIGHFFFQIELHAFDELSFDFTCHFYQFSSPYLHFLRPVLANEMFISKPTKSCKQN